jgi:hypothetical protein
MVIVNLSWVTDLMVLILLSSAWIFITLNTSLTYIFNKTWFELYSVDLLLRIFVHAWVSWGLDKVIHRGW